MSSPNLFSSSDPFSILFIVLSGGFYSDTLAFVNDGCQHSANRTFVHYNKAPGKNQFDCKS